MKSSKLSIIAMSLSVLFSLGLIGMAKTLPEKTVEENMIPILGYEETIFDSSYVHTIDIRVNRNDWEKLKKNALRKECIDSTVLIDGEEINHVGVRTKGNSTLMLNAAKGWDRFSLVLEFDAFQDSQRYHGLDSLSLYNNIFDASYMKGYLCYELMRSMDISTPLSSFAAVHINEEYVGLYAASEIFSQSFALRNYGYDHGQIYKPEQFDIGAILTGELQNTKLNFAVFSEESGNKFTIDKALNISHDAVRLAYLGESLYAYEDIWRNATFPIGVLDKERVVNALKQIQDGDHLGQVVDLDQLARYFAVNTFVLNTDCYTTGMAHNYGLYEKDGILTMLPWDYDVALGNISSEFGITDPSIFINQPIDTPVFNTTIEERPMLRVLLENEEARKLYYQYLDDLITMWMESGKMEAEVDRLAEMIRPWVEKDVEAVFNLEEHIQAVESIKKFTSYRGESIRGQLEGRIPSTWEGQENNVTLLPDYSDYAPPESGMMNIMLPEAEGTEITMENVLKMMPQANKNMHTSVSLPALLNLIDWKQLLTMDFPETEESSFEGISKKDLFAAMMPYPLIAVKLLITALAVPVVMILGLRFVKGFKKRKGGIRHVV